MNDGYIAQGGSQGGGEGTGRCILSVSCEVMSLRFPLQKRVKLFRHDLTLHLRAAVDSGVGGGGSLRPIS